MSILHSPTVSWIQINSEARNNEYLLNVNSTLQKNKFKPGSIVITSSDIGFDSPLLHQWLVTLYALKPDISLPPWKDITHDSLQEIRSYSNVTGNYHLQRSIPGIPVMNQTSNPSLPSHFINMDFCIIFNSVCGSTVSTMTRIYTEISGVQNLAGTRELSLLQNIHTSSSTHPASNSMKTRAISLAVKWPVQTVWSLTSV